MAITNMKEFGETIVDGVSADIDELPKGSMVSWFNSPDGRPTVFRHGEICPFDKFSRVIGIFDAGDAIAIYTLMVNPPEPRPTDFKDQPPRRYTLTKVAPTYLAEVMSVDRMASEIIDEWNELAGGFTSSEQLEAVVEYIGSLDELVNRDRLIDELMEGAHLEDDGEEDEEGEEGDEEVAEGVGAVAPPGPVGPSSSAEAPVAPTAPTPTVS